MAKARHAGAAQQHAARDNDRRPWPPLYSRAVLPNRGRSNVSSVERHRCSINPISPQGCCDAGRLTCMNGNAIQQRHRIAASIGGPPHTIGDPHASPSRPRPLLPSSPARTRRSAMPGTMSIRPRRGHAAPDTAFVTSGVTTQGATAREALDANTAAMAELIADAEGRRHRGARHPDLGLLGEPELRLYRRARRQRLHAAAQDQRLPGLQHRQRPRPRARQRSAPCSTRR